MPTVTYTDGTVLNSTSLSDSQIETIFQQATAQMLGYLSNPSAAPLVLTGVLTSGSPVISSVSRTVLLYAGEVIIGSGIPSGSTVVSVDSVADTVTISSNATANGSTSLSIYDPLVYSKVRVGWQQLGEPGPSIDVDTVAITASTEDTDFSRVRDSGVRSQSGNNVVDTDTFTRTWKIGWIFYGPNSTTNAKLVQSALIKVQAISNFLQASNLYINPAIKEPGRNPEEFQGRWWNRVDMEAECNEQITETITVGSVETVTVDIYDAQGEQAVLTISA